MLWSADPQAAVESVTIANASGVQTLRVQAAVAPPRPGLVWEDDPERSGLPRRLRAGRGGRRHGDVIAERLDGDEQDRGKTSVERRRPGVTAGRARVHAAAVGAGPRPRKSIEADGLRARRHRAAAPGIAGRRPLSGAV